MLSNLDIEIKDIIDEYLEYVINNKNLLEFSEYLILIINFIDHPVIKMPNNSLNGILEAIVSQVENGYLDTYEDSFVLSYLYNVYLALYYKPKNENLIKVQNIVYKHLMLKTELIISKINNCDNLYFFNLFPLLGDIIYLMDEPNPQHEKIVNYVIQCSMNKKIKQWSVPSFYIKNLNKDFNKQFPEGIIPLGMSHGYLKPLLAMSRLVSKGYKQEGLVEGINNLFELYEVFSRRENGLLIWPNFITLDEYINKSFTTDVKQFRCAWCSGNLSMAYGLFKVCRYMGWAEKSKYYYNEIMNILSEDLNYYNLELPIICHGYSFPLLVISNLIRNNHMHLARDSVEMRLLNRKRQEILEKLLNMLNSAEPKEVMEKHFYSNYSILYGGVGALLSLQATISNKTSLVEELLLID